MEEMDKVDYMDKVDGLVLTTPFHSVKRRIIYFQLVTGVRQRIPLNLNRFVLSRFVLIEFFRQPRCARPRSGIKAQPTLLPRINASS